MTTPLVSIIVPTYNSSDYLERCLQSITRQSYRNIELIVVDNNSRDDTKKIALKFTDKVFNKGPERSAQRNYGVVKSNGDYVVIIDSDMELTADVVISCIAETERNPSVRGVIIPEESIGEGLWADCKRLERSFYVGVEWIEAARFFKKTTYEQSGGYNEAMVSGEDWDLSQRIGRLGKIGRIAEYLYHHEGKISLIKTIKKKYYYAQKFNHYVNENKREKNLVHQTGIIDRYRLFFSDSKKLFKNPPLGLCMLFMKTCEFGVGGVGYLIGKLRIHEKHS